MEGGLCVLVLVLLCLVAVFPASAEGLEITVKSGEEVTLKCDAWKYVPLKIVEWSKSEGNMENVLVVYVSQNSDPEIAENNYKDRLELKVRENGEVSLILKNVTEKDSGTYNCYAVKQTNRSPRDIAPPKAVSTIHLKVAHTPGHIGVIMGLVVFTLVVFALSAAFIWKKRNNVSPPPHDEAVETLQV